MYCYVRHFLETVYNYPVLKSIDSSSVDGRNIVKHLHSLSISSLLGRVFSALNLSLCPWNLAQFGGTRKLNNPRRVHLFRVSRWPAASAYFCRTAGLPSCASIVVSSCVRFDVSQFHRFFSAFHPLFEFRIIINRMTHNHEYWSFPCGEPSKLFFIAKRNITCQIVLLRESVRQRRNTITFWFYKFERLRKYITMTIFTYFP